MKKRAFIQYRTAMGSYGSLLWDVEPEAALAEVLPWALENLPSGSLVVSLQLETRLAYPEERVLKAVEL